MTLPYKTWCFDRLCRKELCQRARRILILTSESTEGTFSDSPPDWETGGETLQELSLIHI